MVKLERMIMGIENKGKESEYRDEKKKKKIVKKGKRER